MGKYILWVVAIIFVLGLIIGFSTNWYGLTSPTKPVAVVQPVRVLTPIEIADIVQKVVDANKAAELKAAAELAKAHQDSIAKAEAEAEKKAMSALPAKVAKLEKEVAQLKVVKPVLAGHGTTYNLDHMKVTDEQRAELAKKIHREIEESNLPIVNATATVGKIEVIVGSEIDFDKFGIVVSGQWKEFQKGDELALAPGTYAINAVRGNAWAYDWTSRSMEKPNFVIKVNGVALTSPGRDNGVGGANAWFRLNDDGTITPLN